MKLLGSINNDKDVVNKEYINDYHDNTKQDTLISGTNIKTINNNNLLITDSQTNLNIVETWVGSSEPTSSLGKDGDIYIKISE